MRFIYRLFLLLTLTFLGGCSRNIRPAEVPTLPAPAIPPAEKAEPLTENPLCVRCHIVGEHDSKLVRIKQGGRLQ